MHSSMHGSLPFHFWKIRNMLRWIIFDLILIALFEFLTVIGTPKSSPNWEELISTNGIKFSPRNGPRSISLPLTHIKLYNHSKFLPAQASCVFKGKIWVTGGKTVGYTAYNLLTSYQQADVWYSTTGGLPFSVTYAWFNFHTPFTSIRLMAIWIQDHGRFLRSKYRCSSTGRNSSLVMLWKASLKRMLSYCLIGFLVMATPYPQSISMEMAKRTWCYWLEVMLPRQWTTSGSQRTGRTGCKNELYRLWPYSNKFSSPRYCGLAPWSPRAWHSATTLQGSSFYLQLKAAWQLMMDLMPEQEICGYLVARHWTMRCGCCRAWIWSPECLSRSPEQCMTEIDWETLMNSIHATCLYAYRYNNYTYNLSWVQMPNVSFRISFLYSELNVYIYILKLY